MSTAVTPPMDQTAPLSQMERVIDTFVAPSKTFTDIKRSANWTLAWVVMILCTIAYAYAVGAKVGWDHVSQTQMRFAPAFAQKQLESLPPDVRARAEQQAVGRTKWGTYGFQILNLIGLAITALVLWLTFTFGVGAEIKYKQALAILVFASLPGIIKALLAASVIGMGSVDPDLFMLQNPIGTNAGYFMSFADTPRFLYSLATEVDIFMIWKLVLTAIGFSIVGNVKRTTAYGVVFGWWALFALGAASLAGALS